VPVTWPTGWQPEAVAALEPLLGSDDRVRIVVGRPGDRDGAVLEGYVYLDAAGVPTIIHDRSGSPRVFPWALLAGPVLVIERKVPRRRAEVLFRHPEWSPAPR
jgi:hypothetical protein